MTITRYGGQDAPDGPDRWRTRLERIIEEQRGLYERLDALSVRQSSLIREENTDALLGVLGERQAVIDRLSALAEEFEPFKRQWRELMAQLDESSRDAFNRRIDALAERVSAIAQRDERDREALDERRSRITGELQGLSKGRGAVAAYSRGGTAQPRYQDREG